jgi:hypothetical protein
VIDRRLRRLENRLTPRPDPESERIVEQVRERRRRRLEAEGLPYQEPEPTNFPPGLPVAQALSFAVQQKRQRMAAERDAAAPQQEANQMKHVNHRLRRPETRLAPPPEKRLRFPVMRMDRELALDADTCIEILEECGYLPNVLMCVVNLLISVF